MFVQRLARSQISSIAKGCSRTKSVGTSIIGIRSFRTSSSYFQSIEAQATTAPSSSLGAGAVGTGASDAGGSSSGPEPKPKAKKNRIRTFARTVLVVVSGSFAYIVGKSYIQRNPGEQLPFDSSLPTVVVLGNGWGATSFLKKFDNEGYNLIVISPRNYFNFTPLLPSVTVGTLESRSVIEPTRFITRHKKREVLFIECEATDVDPVQKTVTFKDTSEIKPELSEGTVNYDYLVYAVGAENNTFGIPGVKENACFLKEVWDAEKIRTRVMDCIETAGIPGQSPQEVERLLHMVVVGGGPTGVEYAAELHDFLKEDLTHWYPHLKDKIRITLVEALPNVLPMFSKSLIEFTTKTFARNHIDILTKTMVKNVTDKTIIALDADKKPVEIPYGLLVWATGNTTRQVTRNLMQKLGPEAQNQKRGLVVDDHMRVVGADGIFAMGDATATAYAATAQAASQQGKYLARVFNQMAKKRKLEDAIDEARHSKKDEVNGKVEELVKQLRKASNIRPFEYSHNGSLAYIGSDQAIADLPFLRGNLQIGGFWTMVFWRSAYLSNLFSLRNRLLVVGDWVKVKIFGRDVSRE